MGDRWTTVEEQGSFADLTIDDARWEFPESDMYAIHQNCIVAEIGGFHCGLVTRCRSSPGMPFLMPFTLAAQTQ